MNKRRRFKAKRKRAAKKADAKHQAVRRYVEGTLALQRLRATLTGRMQGLE